MRRSLIALTAVLLLSACASSQSLQQLKLAPMSADPYQAALSHGYQQLAEQKASAGDWAMADYFAAKGLASSRGDTPYPEELGRWNLPPAAVSNLNSAREQLDGAMEANQTTQPALTAAAVVAYDRYVEAAANSTSPEVIDSEAGWFYGALKKLGMVQAAQPGTDAPASEPVVKLTGKAATILYFPFDSDRLGKSAKSALAKLTRTITAKPKATVSINGHTDRAGTEAYNQDLSERRAKFVEQALRSRGAVAKQLHYFAFGESDPAVATEDEVREPKNRRVEIIVE